jgi:hypothetical protein
VNPVVLGLSAIVGCDDTDIDTVLAGVAFRF